MKSKNREAGAANALSVFDVRWLCATGLTFYDDEVIRFFSSHAEGKNAIVLMAAGKSARHKAQ